MEVIFLDPTARVPFAFMGVSLWQSATLVLGTKQYFTRKMEKVLAVNRIQGASSDMIELISRHHQTLVVVPTPVQPPPSISSILLALPLCAQLLALRFVVQLVNAMSPLTMRLITREALQATFVDVPFTAWLYH